MGFDATSYDADYFGVMATDNLDLYNANFFEERHFSNNNNILMVTHKQGDEKSTTSFWAGDMNNKSVPIDFKIKRTGDQIEYWYSLDGKNYEQTSKPIVPINADDVMYVGFCMTAQKAIKNTAHIEGDVKITGEMVGKPINNGETVELDFSTADKENDDTEFSMLTDLPSGARLDGQKITFTPEREGEYVFTASVKDMYHETPVTKTIKVNVAPVIKLTLDGTYIKADASPYIENDRTMVPIRIVSEALGAEIEWNQSAQKVTVTKGGTTIVLKINSDTADVNGKEAKLDSPAVIHGGRTFVPIRFVSENLGWKINWNEAERIVEISK